MLLYTFSGTAVLLGLGGLCLAITAGVWLTRRHLRHQETDVFGYSATVYRFALCASLFTAFLTINWTRTNAAPEEFSVYMVEDLAIDVTPPRTPNPPPPPPPPPPPVIEPVTELLEEEPVEFVDNSITEDEVVAPAPPPSIVEKRVAPPPPPPLPPPAPVDNTVTIFAEEMPVFGEDCVELPKAERRSCSDRALLTFVQSGLNYPALARENGIEGTVVVKFVVEKDGTISGIEDVRGLGGGCTEAALKSIRRINTEGKRFRPGMQQGRKVRVAYNLPVKFKLQ